VSKKPIKKNEGRELQKTRESIGVSQTDLARRAGVSQMLVSSIEAGKRPFTVNSREKIYSALAALGREIAQTIHSPTNAETVQELRARYLGIKGPKLGVEDIPRLIEALDMILVERNAERSKRIHFEQYSSPEGRDIIADKMNEYIEQLKSQILSDTEQRVRDHMLIADLKRLCGIRTEAIVRQEEADALQSEIEQRGLSKDDDE